ncbi:hypothetical protein [Embleya sp. NPDC020886]|uniref:hypothetical protein n=1 Tax=Embleya sp. NPDC020886 TaxID=3363980 RepID=UPI0037B5A2C1
MQVLVTEDEEMPERVWDRTVDPFSDIARVTMCELRAEPGDPQVVRPVPGSGSLR